MTTPTTVVTASKAKAWWALLLPQIPGVVLYVLQLAGSLPPPYGVVFGALFQIVGVVTGTVVHQAPYVKTGQILASATPSAPSSGGWPEP